MAATTKTKTPVKRPRKTAAQKALEHLVLPIEHYEDYISREIGGHSDLDIMHTAKELGHNVLIYGPTGPGKTSAVMAYAAREKLPYYSIPCNGAITPREFIGGIVPAKGGNGAGPKYVWQDGPVSQIMRVGGVINLDEVNFLHPRIGAVFHSALDKRRQIQLLENGGEIVEAHPDTLFVATFNPDYEGTRPLNKAFKNRFAIKMKFDYDRDIENQIIQYPILLSLAQRLREQHRDGTLETPISTNMMMEFEDFAELLGVDFAIENFTSAFMDHEQPVIREVLELKRVQIFTAFGESDPDGLETEFTNPLMDGVAKGYNS